MKYILLISLLAITLNVNGQISGDKNIVTKSFDVSDIKVIDIGLYAKITIDCSASEYLEITADENLFTNIEKAVVGSKLTLDQVKWIQPSQDIIIKIGAPNLIELIQTTHDQTVVNNFSGKSLAVDANTGNIKISGKTDDIAISVGTAKVDATKLLATNGNFLFQSWGEISATVSDKVVTNSRENGKLLLTNKPLEFVGKPTFKIVGEQDKQDASIKFIKFRLKNNSTNRNHFYVVGPKPDGSNFSYGFPMMPYQIRDKDWTNGTKVYKVNDMGLRQLVKIIGLEDENQLVNIFEK